MGSIEKIVNLIFKIWEQKVIQICETETTKRRLNLQWN